MDWHDIWSSSDSTMKAAFIGAAATLTAAFFGFSAIIIQIGAQGRQSRRAIAENERRKLKAAMYEDALLVCRAMSDASIELSNQLLMMDMHLSVASQAAAAGLGFNQPTARFPALSAAYSRFSDAALKVIFLIENRQIIEPRLLIFRTALSVVLHTTRDLMFSEFVIHVMPALPVDHPGGGVFPYTPPALAAYRPIHVLTTSFIDALGDATAYADDLLLDLQNLLLGDLFSTKLQPRVPLDPAKKAVTVTQSEQLEKWFRQTTTWGVQAAQVEAEARARFANGGPGTAG